MSTLRESDTMAFNRSFVAWEQWGFSPTYYACFDPIVLEENADEIHELVRSRACRRFFLNRVGSEYGFDRTEQVTLCELGSGNRFTEVVERVVDFGNIAATSLQILVMLGYRRIAMVGIDAKYPGLEGRADGNALPSCDYFHEDYLRGSRREYPDLTPVLGRWPEVAQHCSDAGIQVVNASPGTALDCFPCVEYLAAIDWVGRSSNENSRVQK